MTAHGVVAEFAIHIEQFRDGGAAAGASFAGPGVAITARLGGRPPLRRRRPAS